MGIIASMRTRVPLWTLLAVIISTFIVNAAVTLAVVRLSERYMWCDLMRVLDEGYSAPVPGAPPPTARGRQIGQGIHELRVRKLGC